MGGARGVDADMRYDWGVGALVDTPTPWRVRADLRHVITDGASPYGITSNLEVLVALSHPLGSSAAPEPEPEPSVDPDGDGVVGDGDACPEVPGAVSAAGCPDADGDAVADADDACPEEAGAAATAGCPDGDADGVADAEDRCPAEAGAPAMAGCADADSDGLATPDDRCPAEAEDEDGFEDADGCPEPDNDQDGIADADDRCPLEPELVNGFEDADGCPEPDTDGDGLVDARDKCPDEPETYNGNKDEDGCPDGASTVVVTADEVTNCQPYQLCGEQGACVNTIADTWACDPSTYGDGLTCDCGCGAPDPDCMPNDTSAGQCPIGVACVSGRCDITRCADPNDCTVMDRCVGIHYDQGRRLSGVCAMEPPIGFGEDGDPCADASDCLSDLCLGNVCAQRCDDDTDCAFDQVCVGIEPPGVTLTTQAGVRPGAWLAVCVAATTSTLTPCADDSECMAPGEQCLGFVDGQTLTPRTLCALPDQAALGTSCGNAAPCPSPLQCVTSASGAPVCARSCPGGQAECGAGATCSPVTFNDQNTIDPMDDVTEAICVP